MVAYWFDLASFTGIWFLVATCFGLCCSYCLNLSNGSILMSNIMTCIKTSTISYVWNLEWLDMVHSQDRTELFFFFSFSAQTIFGSWGIGILTGLIRGVHVLPTLGGVDGSSPHLGFSCASSLTTVNFTT